MSGTVLWVIAGVLCAMVELVAPLMVLIFFALGAWLAALAAACGLGLEWQLGTFMGASILSLLLLRKYARAFFSGRAKKGEDEGLHPQAGRTGVVSKAILPCELGEINIGGSYWRATAQGPVNIGVPVRVLGALPDDALTLIVEQVRSESG